MIHINKTIKIFVGKILITLTYYSHSLSNKNFVSKFLYILLQKILKIIPLTPFELMSNDIYANSHLTSSKIIIDNTRNGFTSNLLYGLDKSTSSLIPTSLPELSIYNHKSVRIQGNSDFIIDILDKVAVNDFSYDINERYENIDGILYRQKANLVLLKYNGLKYNKVYKEGISISGKFSANYYHIMFEIMIKLLVIERANISQNIPLVIDEIVYKTNSFKQLLEILKGTGRNVIVIGPSEIIEFESLYTISSVNIIPPNLKNFFDVSPEDICFDINYLQELRNRLLVHKSKKIFSKRIFISRKKTRNRQYNENEVIDLVNLYDFQTISPEDYDLVDQISIFNGADIIVGASGAAFTNILFCKPKCKIICFQPRKVNIPAFSTIAAIIDAEMRYCLGFARTKDLHSSYDVDLTMLNDMLIKAICDYSN